MASGLTKHACRVAAVAWESHRRMKGLCDWFEFPLNTLLHHGSKWTRYPILAWRTLRLLQKNRPQVVFMQNPSLVLALLVVGLRRVFGGYRVIMDAHNEAIRPFAYPYWPVVLLGRCVIRAVDLTIVTNSALAEDVTHYGGRPAVLPDRLPVVSFEPADLPLAPSPVRVMVIASYAVDEPIREIIEAARHLGAEYQFSLTGQPTKLAPELRQSLPENVRLTGFLAEHEYWDQMDGSHIVLDLTLKPDCLVCGAYEALAMRRPMILSLNPAGLELFGSAAQFATTIDREGIALALVEVRERYGSFATNVLNASLEYSKSWTRAADRIADEIRSWIEEDTRHSRA